MLKNRFFLLLALFSPSAAYAHVKWFLPESVDAGLASYYQFSDGPVLIWIGLALLFVASSIILDSVFPSVPFVRNARSRTIIYTVFRVCVGVSLLLSGYMGHLIAPHYQASAGVQEFLLLLEMAIGLMLIFNVALWLAGVFLLLIPLGVAMGFGFVAMLEYCNMLGIAFFLFLNNLPGKELRESLRQYSIAILRVFTGLALITLGLSEKLLHPELGLQFITDYQWNFMPLLGIEYSDQLFVFSAGMMEVVFGTILILGTTTRVNIMVVSGFMMASNITFLVEQNFGAATMEIIGHLPIIATAAVFLFFGSGQKLKVTSLWGNHEPYRNE